MKLESCAGWNESRSPDPWFHPEGEIIALRKQYRQSFPVLGGEELLYKREGSS